MHLIQILLPLYDNDGTPISRKHFQKVKGELSERFDGLTAYNRNSAQGLWKQGTKFHKDEIVVYEVMVKNPKLEWWKEYRKKLESRFEQKNLVIRSFKIKIL